MLSRLRHVLFLAAALLALSSCSSDDVSSNDTTIPSSRVTQAVAQLDDIVDDVMTRSGIPGLAVAVVHQGKTIYAKGFGVRQLGQPAPIDAHTVFQLASISKPVGATVVAAQVGKELVAWDTPIVQHLPWFSLQDPTATAQVTVGDLYAHRSGLPDHAGDELEELGYDRRQILERLHLLSTEPLRSTYAYTNFGLTAAAQAVAVANDTDWESLSDQALYRPLGMNDTSSRYADFMARTNRAFPHIRINGVFQTGSQRQPDAQSPAGGVSSSVTDMAEWMKLILHEGKYKGQTFIPRTALVPALSPQILSSPGSEGRPAGYYGYGFNVSTSAAGHKTLSHSGAFLMGAGTTVSLLPAADTGIIVLTNALPVGAAEAISMTYMDLVQSGHATRDWLETFEAVFAPMLAPRGKLAGRPFPEHPVPPLALHAYVGNYANAFYGNARVEDRDGKLVLIMGPAEQTMVLQHWGGNVFVFEPEGELVAPGSRSAVTFAMGSGGTAQSVTIEVFDDYGLGTLTRG